MMQWNHTDFDGKVTPATLGKAADLLARVVEADPHYMQAYVAAATVLEALGRYDDAAAAIGRGLAIEPGFEPAQDQKRRLELQAAIERHAYQPMELEALYSEIARLHFKAGDVELSISYLLRALGQNPKSAATWSNLAACYLQTGQLDLSAEALEKALEIDPRSEDLAKRLRDVQSIVGPAARVAERSATRP